MQYNACEYVYGFSNSRTLHNHNIYYNKHYVLAVTKSFTYIY